MLLNHRYFFSPNVSPSAREALSDILEFCSTPSLGKYLGFPIKHVSIPQNFRAIIERMQSRLASWKSHLLSFVGRLVLTQAALFTIPIYNMQCSFLLPRIPTVWISYAGTSCGGLQIGRKKRTWSVGEKLRSPKDEGGLGL